MPPLRSLWFQLGIAIAFVGWLFFSHMNPHKTKLPLSGDLSAVQKQLARLDAPERQLVEDYMARSQGRRIPKRFAGPDEPFTAETFGEAIAAQRKYVQDIAAFELQNAAHRARMDEAYAPLRKLATVELVRATAMPVSQLAVLKAEPQTRWEDLPARAAQTQVRFTQGGREREESVAQYRLRSTTNQTIRILQGTVDVWPEPRNPEAVLPLLSCFITHENIAPHSSQQFLCTGNIGVERTREFMKLGPGQYRVVWSPRLIELDNGIRLQYQEPLRD